MEKGCREDNCGQMHAGKETVRKRLRGKGMWKKKGCWEGDETKGSRESDVGK